MIVGFLADPQFTSNAYGYRGVSCRSTPAIVFTVGASTAWARDPRGRPDLRWPGLRSVSTWPRLTAAHARRAAATPSSPVLSLVSTGPELHALPAQWGVVGFGSVIVGGGFGRATEAIDNRFQRPHGLTDDRIASRHSRLAIERALQ